MRKYGIGFLIFLVVAFLVAPHDTANAVSGAVKGIIDCFKGLGLH